MKIKIEKLAGAIHAGDWHDKPLKWKVSGPKNEIQQFYTKKDALSYAKLRRRSANFGEASRAFVLA